MNNELQLIHDIRSKIITDSTKFKDHSLISGDIGCCLALIESNEIDYDTLVEEYALSILQSSLFNHPKEIDLSYGLTGVGYALLYLIKEGHLENNYNKYFYKQRNYIIKHVMPPLSLVKNIPIYLLDMIRYFILSYSTDNNTDEKWIIENALNLSIEEIYCNLSTNWNKDSKLSKYDNLKKIRQIFELCNLIQKEGLSNHLNIVGFDHLLDLYVKLYSNNFLINDFRLGLSLYNMSRNSFINKIANNHITTYQQGIFYPILQVSDKVLIYDFLSSNNISNHLTESIRLDIQNLASKALDKKLHMPIGLNNGLSMILLHLINDLKKHSKDSQKINISKFAIF